MDAGGAAVAQLVFTSSAILLAVCLSFMGWGMFNLFMTVIGQAMEELQAWRERRQQ